MANMVRTTLSINDELRRDAMSLAAKRDVFYLSEVMREALALWIVREELKTAILGAIDVCENDGHPTEAMACILTDLLEAGK